MATLVLSAVGSAVGGSIGGPIGATLGRAVGAIAGQAIDGALFGKTQKTQGPRLKNLEVQASAEGAAIPRIYGRVRLAGQIIWATQYEEESITQSQGGKGGPRVSSTTYSYYANFAVGLCEGEIARIGRIWADGKLLDSEGLNIRFYKGDSEQMPDPLIIAKQGGAAPAYRGLAYVVFERMPLEVFGNRLPQLSFEVIRPLEGLEKKIKAITIIPGSTEFGYSPNALTRTPAPGETQQENRHAPYAVSDWSASMDEVQALCPNLERVGLVVSWFGDDLRADQCSLMPRVENREKIISGAEPWQAAGLNRQTAPLVSQIENKPAFGGSPSDHTIIEAIQDLKQRGLKVTLIPFIMMDIAQNNTLPNPYEPLQNSQPAYPWRGRITCNPAPGSVGSIDKTAQALIQIQSFLGAAQSSDFSTNGTTLTYNGIQEWSFRRFILHLAHLCNLAGGVDAFILGSELRGLTFIRDSATSHPFVDGLITLASDVRSILGANTILTYGADWSEYHSYQPMDGSGDLSFHLDPLWASQDIDVIGIDNYLPLSDWRDGSEHIDAQYGALNIYDEAYLQSNIEGGEYTDWYYASQSDRDHQIRTPIQDGAYQKHWVFKIKDLKSWWQNSHVNRLNGIETGQTAWIAESKPFWFIELGCPAVDKGANQPNVFPDPKSSENTYPYFSNKQRDDTMQRAFLEAHLSYWQKPAHNPQSSLYQGTMITVEATHIWTWDARPYPWFPYALDIWSDGENWQTGHWINGRLGAVTLKSLIAQICKDYGFTGFDIQNLPQTLEGTLIDRPMSARAALEPLAKIFGFDAKERGADIVFQPRGRGKALQISKEMLVQNKKQPLAAQSRMQETELPSQIALGFIDGTIDYREGLTLSRKLIGQSLRQSAIDMGLVATPAFMDKAASRILQDIWAARQTIHFSLPKSYLATEIGDMVKIASDDIDQIFEIIKIEDGNARMIEAKSIEPSLFDAFVNAARSEIIKAETLFGAPFILPLDLPYFDTNATPYHGAHIAVYANPWPGSVALYKAVEQTGFSFVQNIQNRATLGALTAPLDKARIGLWDKANNLYVQLSSGTLKSITENEVFAGANLCAVQKEKGQWEVLQFKKAELIGDRQWCLSYLIRGQGGTEDMIDQIAPNGSQFIMLDSGVHRLNTAISSLEYEANWRAGPSFKDPSDASYTAISFTPGTRGLQPLSPVHIRAKKHFVSSIIEINWIRRTRINGDSWESTSVPLGEENELYQINIMQGSQIKRSIQVNQPSFLYTLNDQINDFGMSTNNLTISLYQIGSGGRKGVEVTQEFHF